MTKPDRSFMGIRIEGEYNHGRSYCDQRSLEELVAIFKAAFDKGVKAIAWEQYTPYFNDGEPCEFSVGDFAFTTNQVVADAWLDNNAGSEGDCYDYKGELIPGYLRTDFYSYQTPWHTDYPHPDGFVKGDIEMPNGNEFEQVLNQTFGDHTIVVVTPTQVVQSEYDHE